MKKDEKSGRKETRGTEKSKSKRNRGNKKDINTIEERSLR